MAMHVFHCLAVKFIHFRKINPRGYSVFWIFEAIFSIITPFSPGGLLIPIQENIPLPSLQDVKIGLKIFPFSFEILLQIIPGVQEHGCGMTDTIDFMLPARRRNPLFEPVVANIVKMDAAGLFSGQMVNQFSDIAKAVPCILVMQLQTLPAQIICVIPHARPVQHQFLLVKPVLMKEQVFLHQIRGIGISQ
jgi:hypothetical protein